MGIGVELTLILLAIPLNGLFALMRPGSLTAREPSIQARRSRS